jgi:hypothetical protein
MPLPDFDPADHRYTMGDKQIPGASSVAKFVTGSTSPGDGSGFSEAAEAGLLRGRELHAAAEKINAIDDPEKWTPIIDDDPRAASYALAIRRLKSDGWQHVGSEVPVSWRIFVPGFCLTAEQRDAGGGWFMLAGITDSVWLHKARGHVLVVDPKTSSSGAIPRSYYAQVGFYGAAVAEAVKFSKGVEMVHAMILMVRNDGTFQEGDFYNATHMIPLAYPLLTAYAWRMGRRFYGPVPDLPQETDDQGNNYETGSGEVVWT